MKKELFDLLNSKDNFIFDFDGTLTNNEPLQYLVHVKNCKQYGFELSKEDFKKLIIHQQISVIHQNLCNLFNYSFDFEKLKKDLPAFYKEIVEQYEPKLNSYFLDILSEFPNKKLYVLSNESEEFLKYYLSKWNVLFKFTKLISSYTTSKFKILDNIKEYIGENSNTCVIFEDAQKYLTYAKNQGFTTVGVEHEFNKGDLVADYIIEEE